MNAKLFIGLWVVEGGVAWADTALDIESSTRRGAGIAAGPGLTAGVSAPPAAEHSSAPAGRLR